MGAADHPTVDVDGEPERTALQRAAGDAETARSILDDLDGVEDDAPPGTSWKLELLFDTEDLPQVRAELREMCDDR